MKQMYSLNFHRMKQKINRLLIKQKNKSLNKLKALNIVSWNIDGNLNLNSNNYHLFIDAINELSNVYCFQETIGTKFTGYQIKTDNDYGALHDATKITNDEFGVTSIYINEKKISNFIPIQIPKSLYDGMVDTERIYASSVLIMLPKANICIINIYRPPTKTIKSVKQHMKQFQKVKDWINEFLEDVQVEYIVVGDLNVWHESIGSPVRNKDDSMYFKYMLGDQVMKRMKNTVYSCV